MTPDKAHPQESDADEFRITRWQLSQVAKYADLERIVWAILNKPVSHTSAGQPKAQQHKFNSTELLLLANDEWKRREERKHNHENAPWVSGFINGFCTDKKWAREYVDALLQEGRK